MAERTATVQIRGEFDGAQVRAEFDKMIKDLSGKPVPITVSGSLGGGPATSTTTIGGMSAAGTVSMGSQAGAGNLGIGITQLTTAISTLTAALTGQSQRMTPGAAAAVFGPMAAGAGVPMIGAGAGAAMRHRAFEYALLFDQTQDEQRAGNSAARLQGNVMRTRRTYDNDFERGLNEAIGDADNTEAGNYPVAQRQGNFPTFSRLARRFYHDGLYTPFLAMRAMHAAGALAEGDNEYSISMAESMGNLRAVATANLQYARTVAGSVPFGVGNIAAAGANYFTGWETDARRSLAESSMLDRGTDAMRASGMFRAALAGEAGVAGASRGYGRSVAGVENEYRSRIGSIRENEQRESGANTDRINAMRQAIDDRQNDGFFKSVLDDFGFFGSDTDRANLDHEAAGLRRNVGNRSRANDALAKQIRDANLKDINDDFNANVRGNIVAGNAGVRIGTTGYLSGGDVFNTRMQNDLATRREGASYQSLLEKQDAERQDQTAKDPRLLPSLNVRLFGERVAANSANLAAQAQRDAESTRAQRLRDIGFSTSISSNTYAAANDPLGASLAGIYGGARSSITAAQNPQDIGKIIAVAMSDAARQMAGVARGNMLSAMGLEGAANVSALMLANDPLGAQEAAVRNQQKQSLAALPSGWLFDQLGGSRVRAGINAQADAQIALLNKSRDDESRFIDINLTGRERQQAELARNNPVGAGVAGIVASTQAEAFHFELQKRPEEQLRALNLGVGALEQERRDLGRSFHPIEIGQNFETRSPRQDTDLAGILKSINTGIEELKTVIEDLASD